jgi:colanic acid/amylovoran biosynthesis protein
VPAVAIEYEHKTGGIMRDLNLGHWVVKIEDVNADKLSALVDKLVREGPEYRKYLLKVMPGYASMTKNAMKLVSDNYSDLAASK